MKDPMEEMLLVQLSQSEWEQLMYYLGVNQAEGDENMDIIIKKLTNQIY
tara:strand:- start:101 stop:247 length:147 start_codon:yes stop_codon:yes gene_type:complete